MPSILCCGILLKVNNYPSSWTNSVKCPTCNIWSNYNTSTKKWQRSNISLEGPIKNAKINNPIFGSQKQADYFAESAAKTNRNKWFQYDKPYDYKEKESTQVNCCGKSLPFTTYPSPFEKNVCSVCGAEWQYDYKLLQFIKRTKYYAEIDALMTKSVTPKPYLILYTEWCLTNNKVPIRYDVLDEIFLGCEVAADYEAHLNALKDIIPLAHQLSFMTTKNSDKKAVLFKRMEIRLELFGRIPSVTNMLLAYNVIEELTVEIYKLSNTQMDMKLLERFDKLKNLALGTKFIAERKLAFEKSLETILKAVQLELPAPKVKV